MKELLHQDGTPMRKYSSPLINELNEEIMNSKIHESLDRIDESLSIIDEKIKSINSKLDELIKALHDYDDDLSYEPQHGACSGHDAASWEMEDELNKRMDIIGQNGNTGIHYVTNEEADEDAFSDYGERKMGWFDENNNPANKNVGEKKRNKRKYYKPKQ